MANIVLCRPRVNCAPGGDSILPPYFDACPNSMSQRLTKASYIELETLLANHDLESEVPELHGSLCALICVLGAKAGPVFAEQTLVGLPNPSEAPADLLSALADLMNATAEALESGQLAFVLLLPDDESPVVDRTIALASWCAGFLHGLGACADVDGLRARLEVEPLQEIVQDLLAISRAGTDEDDDEDADAEENAYAELCEYLRVVLQLSYEELRDLRESDSDSTQTHH